MRLAILVSHPIQYFVPVYRALAQVPGFDVTVLYRTRVGVDEYQDIGFGEIVKWDVPLLGEYNHQFLSDKNKIGGLEFGVVGALLRNRFDVLMVHGYSSATNLLAIAVGKLIGTKVLIRGDTRLQTHHKGAGIRSLFKRGLFKLCNGFVTIGQLNRAYYAHHGVPQERLFFAPFSVDNKQFALPPDMCTRERVNVRVALGIVPEAQVILFAGKLVKQKRADDLIRAFSMLTDEFPSATLVIAGSGQELSDLQNLAMSIGVERIRFIGFQNQSKLPGLYAAADVFVLPSDTESWGLVINEVMAAGMPVIVSSEVGAGADLVKHGHTGLIYPCGDIEALCSVLRSLLIDPKLCARMALNGRTLIKEWDVEECAKGIVKATIAARRHKGRNVSCNS